MLPTMPPFIPITPSAPWPEVSHLQQQGDPECMATPPRAAARQQGAAIAQLHGRDDALLELSSAGSPAPQGAWRWQAAMTPLPPSVSYEDAELLPMPSSTATPARHRLLSAPSAAQASGATRPSSEMLGERRKAPPRHASLEGKKTAAAAAEAEAEGLRAAAMSSNTHRGPTTPGVHGYRTPGAPHVSSPPRCAMPGAAIHDQQAGGVGWGSAAPAAAARPRKSRKRGAAEGNSQLMALSLTAHQLIEEESEGRYSGEHLLSPAPAPKKARSGKRAPANSAGPAMASPPAMQSPAARSSRYRGVSQHRLTRRWEASLWLDKRQLYLGGFDTEDMAARAYDVAALHLKKPAATAKGRDSGAIRINFPQVDYSDDLKAVAGLSPGEVVAHLRRKSNAFCRGRSGYRGVSGQAGRWESRIGSFFGRKNVSFGVYSTEEEAARQYDRAAVLQQGTFAKGNFPVSDYEAECELHLKLLDATGAKSSLELVKIATPFAPQATAAASTRAAGREGQGAGPRAIVKKEGMPAGEGCVEDYGRCLLLVLQESKGSKGDALPKAALPKGGRQHLAIKGT